jgi:hypothetical protein
MYGECMGVSAARTVGVGRSTVQVLNPGARPAHAERRCFESPGLANGLDLHRKLNRFAACYNQRRVHAGVNGRTPFERCGTSALQLANLPHFACIPRANLARSARTAADPELRLRDAHCRHALYGLGLT